MAKDLKYIKKKRRGLTIEDVFEKKRYRNIIDLIVTYSDPSLNKKIKCGHLKYALVKNYKPKTNTEKDNSQLFFKDHINKDLIDEYTSEYEKEQITKERYDFLVNELKKDKIQELKEKNWLTEETLFPCVQSLRDALTRLKKLNMIKQKDDKPGYDYYINTEIGGTKYLRWLLHTSIDELIPENNRALIILRDVVFDLFLEIQRQQKKS